MRTRQLQTRYVSEPQVNFYRTIAFSFLLITMFLLGVIIFFTSKKAEITIIAKESIKNNSFDVSLVATCVADNCLVGTVTGTTFSWSERYFPTGTKTKEGIATGEITIYNKSNTSQTLVKTTRFINPDGVLFRLKDNTVVPANGEITVAVYADLPGEKGDILPSTFTIPGLTEARQKVVYGESKKAMAGGLSKVGILSETDLKAAEKDYKEKIKQAFLAAHPEIDLPDKQEIISVNNSNLTPSNKAGDEVSEFTVSGRSEVVVIAFNPADLGEMMEKEINQKVDPTLEKLISSKKEPIITVSSVDIKNGTAQLLVTQESTVSLDANAEKLAAQNFAGKKKDAIERYVMGLNYVSGVEIKFSPSWMMSAPMVMDKIKVVVKNVQ